MRRAGTNRRDRWLRRLYAGGRGNATARRYARLWAAVFRLGLQPRRWVTLEVAGRTTGRPTRFPVGLADLEGNWYLVSMLGAGNWVRNVRAAGGRASLLWRHRYPVLLVEVSIPHRAPIIKRYLQTVPGGRPHIPVEHRAPVQAFEAVAAHYPVFRVQAADSNSPWRSIRGDQDP